MREGFFWSAENVVPEKGYMAFSAEPDWSSKGYKVTRFWDLVDRANGDTPLWVARMTTGFTDVAVLSAFRIRDLTVENLWEVRAYNADNKVVYNFSHREPEHYFNCIYDDMPLRGWWSCPQPRKCKVEGEEARSG